MLKYHKQLDFFKCRSKTMDSITDIFKTSEISSQKQHKKSENRSPESNRNIHSIKTQSEINSRNSFNSNQPLVISASLFFISLDSIESFYAELKDSQEKVFLFLIKNKSQLNFDIHNKQIYLFESLFQGIDFYVLEYKEARDKNKNDSRIKQNNSSKKEKQSRIGGSLLFETPKLKLWENFSNNDSTNESESIVAFYQDQKLIHQQKLLPNWIRQVKRIINGPSSAHLPIPKNDLLNIDSKPTNLSPMSAKLRN